MDEHNVKSTGGTRTLPLWNLWLRNGSVRSRAGDLASEAVHVHCGPVNDVSHAALENQLTLGGAAVHGMDPMPRTDAAAIWASRHVLWNLEGGVNSPNALVVDAENGQILGLDAVHVRGVCNGEGTTLQVIVALGENMSAVLNRASD